MAMEPINLFSWRGSAEEVRAFVIARHPDAEVLDPSGDWTDIHIRFPGGRQLRLRHDRDYYTGPDWFKQVSGMQGYFSRFPLGDRGDRTITTIGTFRFSFGTEFDPEYDWPTDPRLVFLSDLCVALDGTFFMPSALRDAHFRVLVSANGDADPEAKWPTAGASITAKRFGEAPADAENDWKAEPPDAARVARRAIALMILSARAVLERDHGKSEHIEANYERLQEWVFDLGIAKEFEPWERDALKVPLGRLNRQTAINAMWRIEGLEVLAWALGLTPLPRYDAMSSVDDVWEAVGFFDGPKVKALMDSPALRPAIELNEFRKQMLGYHWRVREYRVRPVKMDFRAFAAKCWFGSFDLAGFDLLDDELAIQGQRLDQASPEAFGVCQSIAMERHKATNWLCWGPAVYSEADTST